MHELSIAISLIELASEELARQGGGRVTELHLKLGPLCGVEPEALQSAYELARERSALATAKLVIEHVPVQINCPRCRRAREVKSIQEMRCRVCGAPSAQIVHGRELELVAMEICDEASEVS